MAKRCRLTTINNPWDPFTQFTEWFRWDTAELGLNTSAYVASVARTSDQFSDPEEDEAIEWAIDKIIKENPLGIYKKVYEK